MTVSPVSTHGLGLPFCGLPLLKSLSRSFSPSTALLSLPR